MPYETMFIMCNNVEVLYTEVPEATAGDGEGLFPTPTDMGSECRGELAGDFTSGEAGAEGTL